ncbi:MAG: hypothetical protein AAGU05_03800, partial [Anaerolineaceae bacterium]
IDRPAALGIARSLGPRGIAVHGIDTDPLAYGAASKYINPHILPGSVDAESAKLEYLIQLGRKLGQSVLYPLSDDDVLLCSRERKTLEKYYLFVMPDHSTVQNLLTKDGLTRVAEANGVPVPKMYTVSSQSELADLADQLPYPVILKPIVSTMWLRVEIIDMLREDPLSSPPKVALCQNAGQLLQTYRRIAEYDARVIIQEVIPGEDKRLVYICFYLDRNSRPLALFAGRKMRILPTGFGSASYVRSIHHEEMQRTALGLLRDVGYQGLGGMEFKEDPRDGVLKLIEFNVRFGLWDSLGVRCGVDMPYISYRDALGQPAPPQLEYRREYRENVAWFDLQRDLRALLIYRKKRMITLKEWLASYKGEKEWAVYARGDWKPTLYESLKLLQRPFHWFRDRIPLIRKRNQQNTGFTVRHR